MADYKQLVEENFPVNCAKVVKMVQQVQLAPDIQLEEEVLKNFVVDIYDLEVAQGRVAGAFIKQVSSLNVYQGDKFVKFLPSGLAWIGGYGKMEIVSNVPVDNPLLKNGVWFVLVEDKVVPVYPVRQENNQYQPLEIIHLQQLLEQIFS